ncbi:MAG: Crp/Fnr family transcriptional regulator [Flavicella sp.]
MKQKLLDYFSKFRPLDTNEIEIITKDLNIVSFEKGSVLLRAGQKAFDNYFVLQGCVRQYTLKAGKEYISNFYAEEDWILPAIGSENQVTASYFLDCVENCIMVVANDNAGNEMLRNNATFQELAQLILQGEILKQQQHFIAYQSSTPEERYLNLQKTRPDLIERVPQFQLSSYLGVKPESLSRIRKRIIDKQRKG